MDIIQDLEISLVSFQRISAGAGFIPQRSRKLHKVAWNHSWLVSKPVISVRWQTKSSSIGCHQKGSHPKEGRGHHFAMVFCWDVLQFNAVCAVLNVCCRRDLVELEVTGERKPEEDPEKRMAAFIRKTTKIGILLWRRDTLKGRSNHDEIIWMSTMQCCY